MGNTQDPPGNGVTDRGSGVGRSGPLNRRAGCKPLRQPGFGQIITLRREVRSHRLLAVAVSHRSWLASSKLQHTGDSVARSGSALEASKIVMCVDVLNLFSQRR